MRLSDFDYELPAELIAQEPLSERDASRLLVLDRKSGKIEHKRFRDIGEYLGERDILVMNRSKVVKARLLGHREGSNGKVEVFLLKKIDTGLYECLVKATAGKKEGLRFSVGDKIFGEILDATENSMSFQVKLSVKSGDLEETINDLGKVPLPPYITREADLTDAVRYQTVYARELGSVAAPTAGLHFTPALLDGLKANGVQEEFISLHVGLGTFQPIKTENVEEHKMHSEHFSITEKLFQELSHAKENKKRIVAVGTTTVRCLESAARGVKDDTNLFLKPGDEFLWVDALLTNFHQPKSSLLVLVSAFAGNIDLMRAAYQEAIKEKYRFFSYGDAMLIL